MDQPLVWIIIAVVAIIVIALIIWRAGAGKRQESARADAEQLRHDAEPQGRELRERQAEAAAADAQQRRVQAEADEAAARAEQLRVRSEQQRDQVTAAEDQYAASMREADKVDPDVRTDREGYRLDENGDRIGTHVADDRDWDSDRETGAEARHGYAADEEQYADHTDHGYTDHEGRTAADDVHADHGYTPADGRTDDHGYTSATDRRDTDGDGHVSLGERVEGKVDDVTGRRDTDGDGRRG